MDPSKQRHVTQKRADYSEGHDITYSVAVRRLFVLQSWEFKRIYKTECEYYPTIWNFKLKFLEVREDGTASLRVSMKRDDSEDLDLELCVWIQICTLQDRLIFPKIDFDRDHMLPGDEWNEVIEISPFPDRRGLINRGVVIHVSIMVCFCHADTD